MIGKPMSPPDAPPDAEVAGGGPHEGPGETRFMTEKCRLGVTLLGTLSTRSDLGRLSTRPDLDS